MEFPLHKNYKLFCTMECMGMDKMSLIIIKEMEKDLIIPK